MFADDDETEPTTANAEQLLAKSVCLLPFPAEEGLLVGQTKQLRLYENRFLELFDECMEKHEGVVAMGLIDESAGGIIQSVPLCEIEAYNRMDGFGVFVTIRAVGRATLKSVTQSHPFIKANCVELVDDSNPNVVLGSVLVDSVQNMVKYLTKAEDKVSKLLESDQEMIDDEGLPDGMTVSNLEDAFGADRAMEDDLDKSLTREERYQAAYDAALESDTQGYVSVCANGIAETAEASGGGEGLRTPQELTAVSWAAFSTELVTEMDAPYRLQALDTCDAVERLKLGLYLLNEKKEVLKQFLKKQEESNDERDFEAGGFE